VLVTSCHCRSRDFQSFPSQDLPISIRFVASLQDEENSIAPAPQSITSHSNLQIPSVSRYFGKELHSGNQRDGKNIGARPCYSLNRATAATKLGHLSPGFLTNLHHEESAFIVIRANTGCSTLNLMYLMSAGSSPSVFRSGSESDFFFPHLSLRDG
jgi:hypothetical protein